MGEFNEGLLKVHGGGGLRLRSMAGVEGEVEKH